MMKLGSWLELRVLGALLAVTALMVFGAGVARADQITSKGTVLHGKVNSLSAHDVTFAPEYGAGTLTIKWDDIEDIKTDGPVQLLYGEGEEIDGALQGYSNGAVMIGPQIEGAQMVEVKTIEMGMPIGTEGLTWQDRMRSYWRYWSGEFDIGFNYQNATTDTTGLLINFQTTRKNDPLRLIFGATYRYATQTTHTFDQNTLLNTSTTTTTQDYLYGIARAEYDLTARLYAFASGEATYDGIQRLSLRAIPRGGLGYTFWEQKLDADKRNFFSGEVGPSWVYEKYFNPTTEKNYFAIAFGLLAGYYLPYGAHFDGRVSYLPAIDAWTSQYFLHSEASLTMPVYSFISAKFSVIDEYTKPPARDTQSNSLFITFGLSVVWGS